jgi:sulfide:quinone oxidoreductase
MAERSHYPIVIVGGGTAGITVGARLARQVRRQSVAILEPSDKHYYQPLWTLVGAGAAPRRASVRPQARCIPRGSDWLRDAVAEFRPEDNQVLTRAGRRIGYDFLVVAAGIQLDWGKVKGLAGNVGHHGICSNYSYESVESTWDCLRTFRGGTALFTMPDTPVKCGGAPQKIMYLADDHFRRSGVREQARVVYAAAGASIFAVPRYARTLEQVVARKGIETLFRHNLVEVRPEERQAIFEQLDTRERVVLGYDMLHVTPPMSAPDFIKRSPLADGAGWVDVDRHTLRHVRHANVFALGDAANLPTSKTAAAVRKQSPVLVENLLAAMHGRPLPARYDGYTSCPLVTGYGRLVLAEFDYEQRPRETFPFDQSQERFSMYLLKKFGLPLLYWHGMLAGRL